MSLFRLATHPLDRLFAGRRRAGHDSLLVLHVGMPKTGTTSIQNSLAANRDWLYSQGIHYPSLVPGMPGPSTAHHAVAHALAESTLRQRIQLVRFRRRVLRAAVPARMTVLSAEPIYRHLLGRKSTDIEEFLHGHLAYLRRLAEYLSGFDVQILLYLRRPDTFIVSHYKEAINNGNQPPDLGTYATRYAWLTAYPERVSAFHSVFGAPEVRTYEAECAKGLLPGLYSGLAVAPPPVEAETYLRRSPSNRATLWLRRAQHETPRSQQAHRSRVLFTTSDGAHLFAEPDASTLWPSSKIFQAYVARHRHAYEVANLAVPDVATHAPTVWTDAMHAQAQSAFMAWEDSNATLLQARTKKGLKFYER